MGFAGALAGGSGAHRDGAGAGTRGDPDGWGADLRIPDGESAKVSIGGVEAMALRPRLDGDRVSLEVVAPGGSPAAIFRLERTASVRITKPVKFDVEWTGVQDIAEPPDSTSSTQPQK